MPELKFKGKTLIRSYHLTLPYKQLKAVVSKSRNKKPSLDDNLIIHGDNLLALKSLLPSFAGKIKCIYIDPPYNTGNEKWVYNDNVNSPMHQDWLKKAVDRDDLTRHDKWLCMMWPRLVLLRELLREDGVIFVSIDDNEVHRLRAIMDEIFGEENLVASLLWKGRGGRQDSAHMVGLHEYIIAYSRSLKMFEAGEQIKTDEHFSKFDAKKGRRYRTQLARKWGSNSRREDRPKLFYSVTAPDNSEVFPKLPNGNDGCWRWGRSRMSSEIEAGNVEFIKDGSEWVVYQKIYEPLAGEERTKKFTTWLDDVGTTAAGTEDLRVVFGDAPFDYPKPVALIQRIIQIADLSDDDIILDSFAGSGTAGQAVLALNAEDEGSRQFILIEQEEYADKITAERIRRVMKGVPTAKDEALKKGYGGSFSYFTLGPALDEDEMLGGKEMPPYLDLARYVFFTATGEHLDETQVNEQAYYLGESKSYRVYLYYQPNIEFLKNAPLNKPFAQEVLGDWNPGDKMRLVIGSHKFLDDEYLRERHIEFCQLPFAIYRFRAS